MRFYGSCIIAGIALGCVLIWVTGCAQFRDTVGCYTHADGRLGYAHNFGDPDGGSVSSGTGHGDYGRNSFKINQADQFSEDRIDMDVTLRFSPGACAK